MHRASFRWAGLVSGVSALALGVAALVGCANGTDPDGFQESELLNLPFEAGDENSIVLPPPSKPAAG